MNDRPPVTELRLVVTAEDYEEALRFYRDVVGLRERAAYASPGGRVTILEAGRATLELAPRRTRRISTTSKSAGGWPAISGWRSRSAMPALLPPSWRRPVPRSLPSRGQLPGGHSTRASKLPLASS